MSMTGPVIVARFIGDTKQLQASMATASSSGASQFAALGKAAVAMGVVIGAAVAIDFTKDAIQGATDLVEAINKVKVVFVESADEIMEWSKTSAERMGLPQAKALEAVSTFGNLAVSLNLPKTRAAEMSKGMVELAADLGSFNNVPTEDALLAIQSGLVGQVRPLRRFGVNLSEVTLKAQALSEGLIHANVDSLKLSSAQEAAEKANRKAAEALKEHGEGSVEYADAARDAEQAELKLAAVMEGKVPATLDAATKAQAAYSLMMAQTGTAHGDFIRTSGELANSTKIAGAKFEELKAKVGMVLMPAVKDFVNFLITTVIPGLVTFGSALVNNEALGFIADVLKATVIPALKLFGSLIADVILPAAQTLWDFFASNKDALAAVFLGVTAALIAMNLVWVFAIPTMIAGFAAWVVGALSAAAATLLAAAPFVLIGVAIAAVAFLIIRHWDTIKSVTIAVFGAIWNFLKMVFGWIVTGVQTYLGVVVAFWTDAWQGLVLVVGVLWEWIKNVLGWIVTAVKLYLSIVVAVWTAIWEQVMSVVTPLWTLISTVLGFIFMAFAAYGKLIFDFWAGVWELIMAVVMPLWDLISSVWGLIFGIFGLYGQLIVAVWTGVFSVLMAVVGVLWEWIQNVLGWIVTGVQFYLSIVTAFWTDVFQGLIFVALTLWSWIQNVLGWIVTGVQFYLGLVVAFWTGAWDVVKSGATAVWSWVSEKFNAIVGGVQSAMNTVTGAVASAWQSIKDGASAVWSFVTQKWDAIADHFHSIVARIGETAQAIVNAIKTPINALISLWNGLAFEIPTINIPEVDLGPLGKHGGGSLGGFRIDFPNLNYLAKGGVLTSPTLFVGGEAGTEIVAPEDMLRAIVAEEARGGGSYILNLYPRTADASDIAYGFRRLELLAGIS